MFTFRYAGKHPKDVEDCAPKWDVAAARAGPSQGGTLGSAGCVADLSELHGARRANQARTSFLRFRVGFFRF